MRKIVLSYDRLNNRLLLDGSADPITIWIGDETRITVDESVPVSAWVTLDGRDRDIIRNGESNDYYKLPVISTLQGQTLPSEAGVDPREGGDFVMDLTTAQINQTGGHLVNVTDEDTRHYVGVLIDDVVVQKDTDYEIFLSEGERRTILKFRQNGPNPDQLIRVKWRLCPWATTNGVYAGSKVVLKPEFAERWASCYIGLADWRCAPIRISAVQSRGWNMKYSVKESLNEELVGQYPKLAQLLEDFFEYASRERSGVDMLTRLDELEDVDLTLPELLDRMVNERLTDFPKVMAADKKLVLKLAGHFYEARGTLASLNFAARASHGSDATFGYPNERMLRGSESTWVKDEVVRVSSVKDALMQRPETRSRVIGTFRKGLPPQFADYTALLKLKGSNIFGQESKATAMVEDIKTVLVDGFTVVDLYVSKRQGDFLDGEIITPTSVKELDGDPESFSCVVGKQLVGVEFKGVTPDYLLPGNYLSFALAPKEGVGPDGVTPQTYDATPPTAIVVDVKKMRVEISDGGWLIDSIGEGDLMAINETGQYASIGKVIPKVGTARPTRGYWTSGQGFASSRAIRTLDSFFYQAFSYEIVSEDVNVFEGGHVARMIHPTGFRRFGRLEVGVIPSSAAKGSSASQRDIEAGQAGFFIGDIDNADDLMIYVDGKLQSKDDVFVDNVSLSDLSGQQLVKAVGRLREKVKKRSAVVVTKRSLPILDFVSANPPGYATLSGKIGSVYIPLRLKDEEGDHLIALGKVDE